MALPFPIVKHRAKHLDGVPYVNIAQIKRREAKAHDVWLAKIADDAARDQSLDCAKTIGIGVRNLAATLG